MVWPLIVGFSIAPCTLCHCGMILHSHYASSFLLREATRMYQVQKSIAIKTKTLVFPLTSCTYRCFIFFKRRLIKLSYTINFDAIKKHQFVCDFTHFGITSDWSAINS